MWVRLLCAVIFLGFITAGQAAGQEKTFDAWWRGMVETAKDIPCGDRPFRVKWRVVDARSPSPQEIEALRRSIAGHPEHPDRALLAQLESIAAGKPFWVEKQFWIRGSQFRRSDNDSRGDGRGNDCALGDGVAWSLNARELVVMSDTKLAPGYPLDAELSILKPEFGTLMTGGLSYFRRYLDHVRPALTSDTTWDASGTAAFDGDVFEVRIKGTWNPGEGWGTVEEASSHVPASPTPNGWMFRSAHWVPNAILGRPAAKAVTQFDASGKPERRMELIEYEPIDDARFEQIIALPKVNEPDPIRGALTFTSITDYRPDKPIRKTLEGGEVVRAEAESRMPMPAAAASRSFAWWIVLGVLVAALVLVRLKRSAASP